MPTITNSCAEPQRTAVDFQTLHLSLRHVIWMQYRNGIPCQHQFDNEMYHPFEILMFSTIHRSHYQKSKRWNSVGEKFPLISCKLYSVHFLYMLLTVSFNHKINFKFYLYLPNILTRDLRNQFINRRAVSMDCNCTKTYPRHLFQSVLWLLQTNKIKHKIRVKSFLCQDFSIIQ